MVISNKSQKSGDNSVNLQAESMTIHTGLSISHVREVALEVFENNFYKLSGIAREIAEQRVQEFTEQMITELSLKNPHGLKAAEDPDFQSSLFQAQKEYAKCGEKELGDILIDILVDRSKENERSLLQIILNESLIIAPKLNSIQLNILACCFNIAYTQLNSITNIKDFTEYLNNAILVFSDSLNEKDTNYKHLEYVGCISIREGYRELIPLLREHYPAFFVKGFDNEKTAEIRKSSPQLNEVIIRSLHNVNLVQARGMTDDVTRQLCIDSAISEEDTNKLLELNNSNLMSYEEALTFLESICQKFKQFKSNFESTSFKSLELTSVGTAIAHAHSRKKTGFDADLADWI